MKNKLLTLFKPQITQKFDLNIKKKILYYEKEYNKYTIKEINLKNQFNNGKILLLSPYPSENRLNSELYDDILKKLKILKIHENNKIEEERLKKEQELKESNMNTTDKELERLKLLNNKFGKNQTDLSDLELEKIKLLYEIDHIVGISELNVSSTMDFLNEQKMTNISFIIDPERELNKKNNLNFRYEIIIEGEKLIDLKVDPTGKSLAFEYFAFIYFALICFFICGYGFYYNVHSFFHNLKFMKYYRDIYSRNILISKMKV